MTRHLVFRSCARRAVATAVLLAAVAAPSAAQPTTTLTFDTVTPKAGSLLTQLPTPYATQGYSFGCVSSNPAYTTPCPSLYAVNPGSPGYAGRPTLFNNNVYGITTLARQDGGAFNLLSLGMAVFNTSLVGPMVFEGTLAGGGTVTQTFALSGAVGALSTYTFSAAFTDLLSVRYMGVGADGQNFSSAGTYVVPSVTDVVVQSVGPAVVPEPATWALLGAGLVGVSAIARRGRVRGRLRPVDVGGA